MLLSSILYASRLKRACLSVARFLSSVHIFPECRSTQFTFGSKFVVVVVVVVVVVAAVVVVVLLLLLLLLFSH